MVSQKLEIILRFAEYVETMQTVSAMNSSLNSESNPLGSTHSPVSYQPASPTVVDNWPMTNFIRQHLLDKYESTTTSRTSHSRSTTPNSLSRPNYNSGSRNTTPNRSSNKKTPVTSSPVKKSLTTTDSTSSLHLAPPPPILLQVWLDNTFLN